jgi:TonB family protein
MKFDSRMSTSGQYRRAGFRVIQAAALVMALAMAVPGNAEDRAVKQRVPPAYPEIAKRMRISGVVTMSVTVNPEGKVTDVKTTSGNRVLSIAAEDAVRKWKFEPGAAVSTVDVSMNFALE